MEPCSGCGQPVANPATGFCDHCGTPLPGAAGPGQPVVGAGAPPMPAARSNDERNWGLAAHVSALVAFLGVPSVLGPLVVWLVVKDKHPFACEHAKEALNFNLSVLLYLLVGGSVMALFALGTLGFGLVLVVPLLLGAFIAWVILVVLAAVEASKGRSYRYPVTIRLIT